MRTGIGEGQVQTRKETGLTPATARGAVNTAAPTIATGEMIGEAAAIGTAAPPVLCPADQGMAVDIQTGTVIGIKGIPGGRITIAACSRIGV